MCVIVQKLAECIATPAFCGITVFLRYPMRKTSHALGWHCRGDETNFLESFKGKKHGVMRKPLLASDAFFVPTAAGHWLRLYGR